jgi:hypothetical protein
MNHLIKMPYGLAAYRKLGERPAYLPNMGRVSSALLIFSTVIVVGSAFLWGERIAVNDGLGWDGCQYAAWARDFRGQVLSGNLSPSRAGRILPSGLVHYGFRAFGIPLTTRNIIWGFVSLDIMALVSMAFLWSGIARQLSLSRTGEWFGALCLFGSFAVLKMTPYLPVQTDICAMALSLALVYCYLRQRTVAGVLLTLAGSLVWPGLIGQGAILQVFPSTKAQGARRATTLAAGLSVAFLTVAAVFVAWPRFGYRTPWLDARLAWVGDSTRRPGIALFSSVLLALYIFFVIRELTDPDHYLRPTYWRRMLKIGPGLAIFVFLLGRHWLFATWPRLPPNYSVTEMCLLLMDTTLRLPALSVLALLTYFGPVVLLIVITWPALCQELHSRGPGLPLAAGLGALLAMDPESRHCIHLIPLIVPFLVKVIDRHGWTGTQILSFALVSLIWSKIWLVMGGEPDPTRWTALPAQRFFMHIGPLMSERMYCVHGLAALVCGGLFWYLFRSAASPGMATISRGAQVRMPGQAA